MFLRAVLLCGLYALALACPLREPSSDFSVGELERGSYPPTDSPTDSNVMLEGGSYLLSKPSTDSIVSLESSSHLVQMALSDSGSCGEFWESFGADCYRYVDKQGEGTDCSVGPGVSSVGPGVSSVGPGVSSVTADSGFSTGSAARGASNSSADHPTGRVLTRAVHRQKSSEPSVTLMIALIGLLMYSVT
ncbi:unnamed protein product [Arctogadus glacialis]